MWDRVSPAITPRASGSMIGVRSPEKYGSISRPLAPGPDSAARRVSPAWSASANRSRSQLVTAPEVAMPPARLRVPGSAPTVPHRDGLVSGLGTVWMRNSGVARRGQLPGQLGELAPPHGGVHFEAAGARSCGGVLPYGGPDWCAVEADEDALAARGADVHTDDYVARHGEHARRNRFQRQGPAHKWPFCSGNTASSRQQPPLEVPVRHTS